MTAPDLQELGSTSGGFRVIRLEAENTMRLTAVDIVPDGTFQVVEGANAQGKSSVLDALFFALAGGGAQRGRTEIIHQGEKRAKVRVTLSDGSQTAIVERLWTKNNDPGKLTLTDEHGVPYKRPRDVLDSLINERCFDPLAFANAPAKDQRAGLLSVVDLAETVDGVRVPLDLNGLEAERAELYEERTSANRDVKRLEVAVDQRPPVPADTPDEEVSVAELAQEAARIQQAWAEADRQTAVIQQAEAAVESLREQLAQAETALADLRSNAIDTTTLPDPDTSKIGEAIANAEATNAAVRAKHQRREAVDQLGHARTAADALTASIEAIDARKAKALEEATLPLPGLGFDEDGVTYQGLPFAQASGAERLRVSCAMAIAANPAVRTMIVRDGPLLDAAGMAALERIARDNDFQIIVERVSDGTTPTGIVIVDGKVAEGDTPLAPEAAEAVEDVALEVAAESAASAAGAFSWLDES